MPVFNQSRQTVIRLIFLATFLILVARIFILQVLSPQYQLQAIDNAINKKVVYPDRGIIFDRNGKAILQNTITYDLMFEPTKLKGIDTAGLCQILEIDSAEFRNRIVSGIIKNGRYRPSVFEGSLSTERFVKLQENIFRFEPGFYLQDRPIRSYPYKTAAHLLGYIGEVDSNILKRTNYFYQMGDYMGLTGLERFYESILMGQRGVQHQIKDNKNRIVGLYENGRFDTPAVAGRNLRTYLDIDIQVLAEKMLTNKIGAVVAIEPKTGGVIAMASGPTYDPNLLTGSERRRNFSYMLADTAKPLYNRTIKGQYPPGSTFKPLGALVALDEGVITPQFGYSCSGAYLACRRPIQCEHKNPGHASNLRQALANSCNSYFSHVFRLAADNPKYRNVKDGYAKWKEYMNAFGLGQKLGVDLPSEDTGFIPRVGFFDTRYSGSWNSCTNVFLGIGQGEMTATPLQMANLMSIIANKGYYYTPHFVERIDGEGEGDTILNKFKVKHEVTHIPDTVYQIVQWGMQDVVDRGTGVGARIEGISIAGKTGTAENYGMINGKREKLKNHSWFVCFAPREDPKIAIAVIVENAGFGATWAAPMASLMIEQYLHDSIASSRKAILDRIVNADLIPEIVKKKRMQLDSIRRVRLSLEMGDSSALYHSLPDAPASPKLDSNLFRDKRTPVIINNPFRKDSIKSKDSIEIKKDSTENGKDSSNRKSPTKQVAILAKDERKKS